MSDWLVCVRAVAFVSVCQFMIHIFRAILFLHSSSLEPLHPSYATKFRDVFHVGLWWTEALLGTLQYSDK